MSPRSILPKPPEARDPSTAELDAIMSQPDHVRAISRLLGAVGDRLNPLVDLYRPYVDGLENLPRDGRFLLVGNHTATGMAEVFFIPYYVRRELGVRVRPLADRMMAAQRGPGRALLAAYGGVVGHPHSARELMQHNETVLVFPGGGREIPKFKGEEYQLRWDGRSGFARVAIAHDYPIVPVGLVGGDDVYQALTERDSAMGRFIEGVGARLSGRGDMSMPLVRGVGPTLLPRPQRMYLRFGEAIDTVKPARARAATWEQQVKGATQDALEQILTDLLELRADDPFRALNPLAWRAAVQPA